MKLDSELFAVLNAKQSVGNKSPVVYGAPGVSAGQIASIEAQLGFRLPDDFAYLLQNLQDPGAVLFPWMDFDKREYDQSIDCVWRGIEFDIKNNVVWLERWGARPDTLSIAIDQAKKDFLRWPKLLPIYSHRFLAAEPCLSGNPVFSIKQTDIIYYGADLARYLLAEFVDTSYVPRSFENVRRIEVWSDFAECRIP